MRVFLITAFVFHGIACCHSLSRTISGLGSTFLIQLGNAWQFILSTSGKEGQLLMKLATTGHEGSQYVHRLVILWKNF